MSLHLINYGLIYCSGILTYYFFNKSKKYIKNLKKQIVKRVSKSVIKQMNKANQNNNIDNCDSDIYINNDDYIDLYNYINQEVVDGLTNIYETISPENPIMKLELSMGDLTKDDDCIYELFLGAARINSKQNKKLFNFLAYTYSKVKDKTNKFVNDIQYETNFIIEDNRIIPVVVVLKAINPNEEKRYIIDVYLNQQN